MSTSNLISVDWGTSNLRIRSIKVSSMEMGPIYKGKYGIKALNDKCQRTDRQRSDYFLDCLMNEIKSTTIAAGADIPIIISGMASSSIGIKELPYATLPFSCNGSGLRIEPVLHRSHTNIHLISGVKDEADVMRGEETQLIGISDEIPTGGTSLIILPGTHSKHVEITDGEVVNFETFLTGELFEVMSAHTILKNSLNKSSKSPEDLSFFREGVQAAAQGQFLQSLFKIRAKDLLGKQTKGQNYHFLSGLHLGLELSSLRDSSADIYLASVEPLSTLYQEAANALDIDLHLIPPANVQNAVVKGHLQIYNSSILS